MNFYSDAKQDQFVANLLNFKRDGVYLDIGSCDSAISNNSFAFDHFLDWAGICVELNSICNESYKNRKNCQYFNDDATKLDYLSILNKANFPKTIDYLSLDVDTLSVEVLNFLPFSDYTFKVITIEHDSYLYGDKYKTPQRDFLTKAGYELVCSDVLVEQEGFYNTVSPFEDWWVHKGYFEPSILDNIRSASELPSSILNKFVK
jgi:hypothetical protein